MTDGVVKANMTSNDAIETYAPDPSVFHGEYFSEKLETQRGGIAPVATKTGFEALPRRSRTSWAQSARPANPARASTSL